MLNAVSWSSELKWPNDLDGQGPWPPFSISAEIIQRCILGTNLIILAQIHYKVLCGQFKFPRILSHNDQNDLEVEYNIFNSSWDYPMMHVWCKFGEFSSNLLDELSCGHAKVYGQTDRRTDRQMQATTIPIWPERSRGKNIYFVSYIKREMCVWLYCTIRWVSHFSWVEWASMLWWWPHECSWWSIRQYLSAFMTWGIVRLN